MYISQSVVTRLGVCIQSNLNAKLTGLRAFYFEVLLLTVAYSDYTGHFFLGQFPNMELLNFMSKLDHLILDYCNSNIHVCF